MKSLIITVTFLLFAVMQINANDGVFYAQGGHLIPVQETRIELKKEILSLRRAGEYMNVHIHFEFYNPDKAKELLVGFVTPPAVGDVTEEETKHPQISDFYVMVNGSLLPYKITTLEESGFKLSDKVAKGYDFVYYFKVKFKKGHNVIKHAYQYKGGNNIASRFDFDYRITTGTTWANRQIDDFELNIDLGKDAYFTVPYTFNKNGKACNWEVVGVGQVDPHKYDMFGNPIQMVKIKRGHLRFKAQNFRPDYDLALTSPLTYEAMSFWSAKGKYPKFSDLSMIIMQSESGRVDAVELHSLSKKELRLFRNYVFATYGYVFQSKELQDLFSNFNWYIPDPNFNKNTASMSAKDKRLIKAIKAEEKKR